AGEHVVAVHPWSTTPDDDPALSPGVELFVLHARERDPRLRLKGADLAGVARIVHLVGGLPLAIELVARRVGALSITTIEEQLGRHSIPHLPSVDRHVATRRHQAIRRALDW